MLDLLQTPKMVIAISSAWQGTGGSVWGVLRRMWGLGNMRPNEPGQRLVPSQARHVGWVAAQKCFCQQQLNSHRSCALEVRPLHSQESLLLALLVALPGCTEGAHKWWKRHSPGSFMLGNDCPSKRERTGRKSHPTLSPLTCS